MTSRFLEIFIFFDLESIFGCRDFFAHALKKCLCSGAAYCTVSTLNSLCSQEVRDLTTSEHVLHFFPLWRFSVTINIHTIILILLLT